MECCLTNPKPSCVKERGPSNTSNDHVWELRSALTACRGDATAMVSLSVLQSHTLLFPQLDWKHDGGVLGIVGLTLQTTTSSCCHSMLTLANQRGSPKHDDSAMQSPLLITGLSRLPQCIVHEFQCSWFPSCRPLITLRAC